MTPTSSESAIKTVEALFRAGAVGAETDGRLLGRFLEAEPAIAASAFESLVERHAAMVLGVCRRRLLDPHDAEDAAQATFLVLARRARSIRDRESLASWLFGVADRVAKRARAVANRRQEHERRRAEMTRIRESEEPSESGILDEEIARLPERLRGPIVLCYLEGLTQEQAAARLDLPLRTIQRRLAQGRDRLKARLQRRGVSIPGEAKPALLALPFGRPVEPPPGWVAETTRAASAFAARNGGAAIGSAAVNQLAHSEMRGLTMAQARATMFWVAAVGVVAIGLAIPMLGRVAPPRHVPDSPKTADESRESIAFTVRDSKTHKPMADVVLKIMEKRGVTAAEVTTDANGLASLPLGDAVPNNLMVSARKRGYVPIGLRWVAGEGRPVPKTFELNLNTGISIGGRVLDEQGKAVAGAKVVLASFDRRDPGALMFINLGDETITTGADGSWRFDDAPAPPTAVHVRADHPGFIHEEGFRVDTQPSGESLKDYSAETTLRKGRVVFGSVLDDAGNPVAGAEVTAGRGGFRDPDNPRATTDENGRYRLTRVNPGHEAFIARARGHSPDVKRIVVDDGMGEVNLRLGPDRTLRGRVIDRAGQPIDDASVTLESWRGEHGLLDVQVTTAADGRFRVENAPADAVGLIVTKPGYMGAAWEKVVAGDGTSIITLSPEWKITGTVRDAETKEPIPHFKAILDDPARVAFETWAKNNGKPFHDGQFHLAADWPYPTQRAVRIDADGYLPEISETYNVAGGGEVARDFLLKRGRIAERKPIVGTIRKADGSPVSGALVCVSLQGQTLVLRNGRTLPGNESNEVRTAADGSFQFPPQNLPALVAALDDAGYAFATEEELAESKAITLAPWSHVEGHIRSGDNPLPRADVWLSPAGRKFEAIRRVSYDWCVEADDRGVFRFDRVIPGELKPFRSVPLELGRGGMVPYKKIVVKPGETARIAIGGGGRTVVGRVNLRGGEKLELDWAQADNRMTQIVPPPPEPPNLNAREKALWLANWERSEAGQLHAAALDDQASYPFMIAADGTFRMDDVREGSYSLDIKAVSQRQQQRIPIAQGHRNIVVSPPLANDIGKPLDIGIIDIRPTGL